VFPRLRFLPQNLLANAFVPSLGSNKHHILGDGEFISGNEITSTLKLIFRLNLVPKCKNSEKPKNLDLFSLQVNLKIVPVLLPAYTIYEDGKGRVFRNVGT